MARSTRFGRKIPMPSTMVLKHKLRLMAATDALVATLRSEGHSEKDLREIVNDFVEKYSISSEDSLKLIERIDNHSGALKIV